MADRTITSRLTLDPSGFESGMQRAAKAAQGLGDVNQKTAQQSQSAMQRMARSARENRAEWQQVGGSLAIVGGAVTGLMTLVAKTGIGYNNLRQTATQGLTAVTGSTEAAAEQMRKLDEYGQNSWLMRDSLIRAQQQMTGFGIETEKVIPYMNALAEGVAASGGSSQDFEELARIMGQVNSQGKLTAETFNQFGIRGIDAAQMIGDAMGKTAGEIREDVTSGALDAGVALDALAEGLVMNYEGASDLVRGTFRGAVDDVMAAFRDISAIAMTPLVDPEGGGLLVGLLNQVSDLMFALRDLPPWLIQAGAGITTLGGLAAAGAGGFMLLVPRLVETWDALGRMGTMGPRAQDALRRVAGPVGRLAGYGAALGVTAAVLGSIMGAITRPGVARDAEHVADAIRDMADAGESLADVRLDVLMSELATLDFGAFEVAKTQADDLAGAMERLADPSVTDRMSQFFGAVIPGVTSYMADYQDILESFGAGLTHLAQTDLPEAQRAFENLADSMGVTTTQGAIELIDQIPGLRNALVEIAESAGMATDDVSLLNIMLGQMPPEAEAAAGAQGLLGDATGDTTGEMQTQAEAVRELMDEMRTAAGVVLSMREAENRLEEAYESATEAIRENGETLDVTSEKGRNNRRALDDIADATWSMIQAADENGASQGELQGIMQRSRERFIETAEAMGMSSAEANRLADELNLIPSDVRATVTVAGIENSLSSLGVLDRTLNNINGKTVTATVAVRQYGQAAVASGGYMGDFARLAAGGQPPRARGLLEGPGTTTSDSIHALLSRKEFVVNATATDYYSPAVMYALNRRQIPKEALVQGYAGGGTPRHLTQYMPAPSSTGSVSVAAPSVQVFIGDEEVTGRVRVVVRDELGAGARADGRRARMAGVS